MVVLARRRSSLMRTFDWTREARPARDFEKCTRENVDWSKSPLGPIALWPAALRQMVLVSMADTIPSAVIYGPIATSAIVYNEAFAELIGKRHPNLQGQLVKDELVNLCPEFDATWQRQTETGKIEVLGNQRVRQELLGFVEEKVYCWKLLPMIGEDGSVVGSLVTVDEDNKPPPRRERSKSAVRDLGNVVKTAIDRTASQTAANILRLDEHFTGRACSCAKLWEVQRQLEEKEALFEKFGNLAPVGIAALFSNDDYSLDWANSSYWDIMAQPPDSKDFLDYIYPEDVDKVRGHLELGSFRQESFSFQCRLKKHAARAAVSPSEAVPEASPAWILISAFRDPGHANTIMCWIIDISSHKSAEDFLRRRMDEALEMKVQKERFIDQISHEVRNPLSAMIHCTDDILSTLRSPTPSHPEILSAAQTIAFCTHHIKTIVDDVLTLSKLDSRLVLISPVPTRPREVVEQAITIFQRELNSSKICLSFSEDASIQGVEWLLMDPVRYLQVLFNMVTNAIKVVKGRNGVRAIAVRLSAAKSLEGVVADVGEDVQFVTPRHAGKPVEFGEKNREESVFLVTSVQDTGPGLTGQDMELLFARFRQASPKTESKYGKNGLGLFISRDLTELQGGRIGVSSEDGKGSRFVFSVEAKRCEAPESLPKAPLALHIPKWIKGGSEGDYSPVLSLPPEPLHEQEEKDAKKVDITPEKQTVRKVLIVEDNLINQRVLANQLRKRGYHVDTALHGEEALARLHISLTPPTTPLMTIPRKPLASTAFDVVLMDIEMPVMDGISCVQRIRSFEAARGGRMPIIAVTANARSEHGTKALEAGMDSITTKPYKIEELVVQIERACGEMG